MNSPWREPGEESTNLYPGLVVHDGRVSGSITIGRTRLPIWAIISTAIRDGWPAVTAEYEPPSEFTEEHLADFLYWLMEQRGEFARLLLVLADVERDEAERDDDGLTPWWDHEPSRCRVIDQLQRCLQALGANQPQPERRTT